MASVSKMLDNMCEAKKKLRERSINTINSKLQQEKEKKNENS